MGNKIRAVWAPAGGGIALIETAKVVAKGATTLQGSRPNHALIYSNVKPGNKLDTG
jgi:hypothetical protein